MQNFNFIGTRPSTDDPELTGLIFIDEKKESFFTVYVASEHAEIIDDYLAGDLEECCEVLVEFPFSLLDQLHLGIMATQLDHDNDLEMVVAMFLFENEAMDGVEFIQSRVPITLAVIASERYSVPLFVSPAAL
ncbi:MAG: hypothetical protein ACTSWQ_03640, partial [Candidatus Thorarchaeota archaeon]